MEFFDKDKIHGEIGYFNLQNWWLNELTNTERTTILRVYIPLGSDSSSLIKGHTIYSSGNPLRLLNGLASWFDKAETESILRKILLEAEKQLTKSESILDIHFFYHNKIKFTYKQRNSNSTAINDTIKNCEAQISISIDTANEFKSQYKNTSLPSHLGYKQLSIILEKQKQFEKALSVCEKAQNEGWAEDWGKRIERLKKRITKN